MANEKLIAHHMKQLGCTREEALEVIAYDEAVEKGQATPYDLTAEQKKVQKEMTTTGTRKTTKTVKTERKRTENTTKSTIIAEISQFLSTLQAETCENVQITNAERTISFVVGDNSYELSLIQHRKPKN